MYREARLIFLAGGPEMLDGNDQPVPPSTAERSKIAVEIGESLSDRVAEADFANMEQGVENDNYLLDLVVALEEVRSNEQLSVPNSFWEGVNDYLEVKISNGTTFTADMWHKLKGIKELRVVMATAQEKQDEIYAEVEGLEDQAMDLREVLFLESDAPTKLVRTYNNLRTKIDELLYVHDRRLQDMILPELGIKEVRASLEVITFINTYVLPNIPLGPGDKETFWRGFMKGIESEVASVLFLASNFRSLADDPKAREAFIERLSLDGVSEMAGNLWDGAGETMVEIYQDVVGEGEMAGWETFGFYVAKVGTLVVPIGKAGKLVTLASIGGSANKLISRNPDQVFAKDYQARLVQVLSSSRPDMQLREVRNWASKILIKALEDVQGHKESDLVVALDELAENGGGKIRQDSPIMKLLVA